MKAVTEPELVELVAGWVRRNSARPDAATVEIGAGTDLIDTGLLDSLGIVDLIVYVENETGGRVDLSEADPATLGVVGSLCRLALDGVRG